MTPDEPLYTRHVSPNGRVSYVPHGARFDADNWPTGAHLVVVQPGLRSIRYRIDPDHAGLLAAGREHRDALIAVVRDAMTGKPETPLPPDLETRLAGIWFRHESPAGVVDALIDAAARCVTAAKNPDATKTT